MSELAAAARENAEWQALIGKAIAFFGEIELISIKCLAHIPADTVADTATRLEFSRRTDLLLEILTSRENPSESISVLIRGFKRAKQLAKTRNLIAHNPVMLDLYVNETKTDGYVERSIRSARGGAEPFKLHDLKEFADEVEDLASELWLHFMKAADSSDAAYRLHEDPDA